MNTMLMKKGSFYAIFMLLSLLWAACTPKNSPHLGKTPVHPEQQSDYNEIGKPMMGGEDDEEMLYEEMPYTVMEEVEIVPEIPDLPDTLPVYRASHTFEHDLIHTRIEISFDWEKKRANGTATLSLKPWFYSTDQLTLDAKNFDIHRIALAGTDKPLTFDYDGSQIRIRLDRTYTRNDTFSVVIGYTAKPDEREDIGGSAAISSDKGLYFINADGSEAGKPRQIWTQGETEANSCWFPTIDKPNQRCTQEIYITVADSLTTLSNGLLVSSKKNGDGTRTDYWKMDIPHAPYLFAMAIGKYAVVKDQWRGKEVSYYVEPAFEPHARNIFPHTPEMLEFFSNLLKYPYPWPKYSQVVVRDFVSGAMENTSAVIFGEFVQLTTHELLDNQHTNEKIVAHEMFHHWFGDLVTTESWANLTLNEGFANYSEYLWLEYKYGRDVADHHLSTEHEGYLYSAQDGGHPLIDFGYDSREDMFDAHSYNKGGSILHMLRTYLGDEAFFASLNKYLIDNAYSDVEAHELRLAFEDVSGQDLSWFFNQWFFGAGHPVLDITYDWDADAKEAVMTVAQQQSGEKIAPIFQLPLFVDVYDRAGKATRHQIWLTKREQEFRFPAAEKPALVNFDAEKALLCIKNDQHTEAEWLFMMQHGPLYQDRREALDMLQPSQGQEFMAAIRLALKDPAADIRYRALRILDAGSTDFFDQVVQLAENDPEPSVRSSAISLLGIAMDTAYIPLFKRGLASDLPYSVIGASLGALAGVDPAAASEASRSLENIESQDMILTLASIYAEQGNREFAPWFRKRAEKMDYMAAFAYFEYYQRFVGMINDPAVTDEAIQYWNSVSLSATQSPFRRFSATKAIADMRNQLREAGQAEKAEGLDKLLAEIIEKETDPTLKMYYGMF